MARPRADGTPARAVNRKKLTDLFVATCKPGERDYLIWDLKQPGLALSVRTTGRKAWKVIYRYRGRVRWMHLGDTRSIGLADSRRHTAKAMLDVLEGRDPAALRKVQQLTGSFADLASQYVKLHAKAHNKSWKQAERLVAAATLGQVAGLGDRPLRRQVDDGERGGSDRRQPDAGRRQRDLHMGLQAGTHHRQSLPRCRPQSDHRPRAGAVGCRAGRALA